MKKIKASRLADGNKLFVPSITLDDAGLYVKLPGLFKGKETFLNYKDISAVTVDAPLVGFSTINFNAKGTWVSVHGFKSNEVKEIKAAIQQGYYKPDKVEVIEHYHSDRLTADDNVVIGMNDQSYEQNSVSAVADDNDNVELDKLDKKARIQEAKLLKKQIELEKERGDEEKEEKIFASIMEINFGKDKDQIVNQLIAIKDIAERYALDDSEKYNVAESKFKSGIMLLASIDPNNPMIPFFNSAIHEWKQKKEKHKKDDIKHIITYLVLVVLFFALLAIFDK